jgi:hypothetical protein
MMANRVESSVKVKVLSEGSDGRYIMGFGPGSAMNLRVTIGAEISTTAFVG